MSIRVEDKKHRKLKAIASIEGKSMTEIMGNLIDDYIKNYRNGKRKNNELDALMKVSEPAFEEWDNEEDEIYNDL